MDETKNLDTIQIIIDLKYEGDSFLGYTLIDSEVGGIYVDTKTAEILRHNPIVIDSGCRSNVKKGDKSKLEELIPIDTLAEISNDRIKVLGKIKKYDYHSRRSNVDAVVALLEIESINDVQLKGLDGTWLRDEYLAGILVGKNNLVAVNNIRSITIIES